MDNVLDIATKISTPISLAALAVIVLLLVYKLVFEKLVLSTLGAGHTYRIVNRTLTYLFILALVGLILGITSFVAVEFVGSAVGFIRDTDLADNIRELGDSSPDVRLSAIHSLSTVAQRDRKLAPTVCDGLASFVRRAASWQGGPILARLPDDIQLAVEAISQLKKDNRCTTPDLAGSDLRRLRLPDGDLSAARLVRTHFDSANLKSINLQGARLDGADLDRANLQNANLREAHFSNASLRDTDLRSANMTNATGLAGADLRTAALAASALDGADLRSAKLQGVDLTDASLENADLRGTDLRGARGLCRKQLEAIVKDARTTLPENLKC